MGYMETIRMLAEDGNASAQYTLGMMFYEGKGVSQDYKEAEKWLRLSAEQGFIAAQCELGAIYTDGRGVPQNKTEGIKWY